MKKPKSYRFSPYILNQLEELKQLDRYKDYNETDIVQEAISHLWVQRIMRDRPEKKAGD